MSYDCIYPTTKQLENRLYDLMQIEEPNDSELAEIADIQESLDWADFEMTRYRARRDTAPW